MLQKAVDGEIIGVEEDDQMQELEYEWAKAYLRVANTCRGWTETPEFQNFITIVIIIAGIMVGLSTDVKIDRGAKTFLETVDGIILFIFTVEVILCWIGNYTRDA